MTNFEQGSVFASAPTPMGALNRDPNYSPLWQMIKATWAAGSAPRTLKSEAEVLSAAERGQARLEATRVVLNCPIVHRGPQAGGLPGVSLGRAMP